MKRYALALAALTTSLLASNALAIYDTAGFPYCPDPNYASTDTASFAEGKTIRKMTDKIEKLATPPQPISTTPGSSSQIDSFFDVFTEISLDGGSSWTLRTAKAHTHIGEVCDDGNDFSTEMLALDLTFDPPPPGQVSPPLMIRESPTLQSLGHMSGSPNADGSFRINSFFDVFLELSTDGGASWTPASQSIHLDAVQDIPEPASLLVTSIGSLFLLRRRNR